MASRIADFMRPGGLATATQKSWDLAFALNPEFTERCQWGHQHLGWPIATYETAQALRGAGFVEQADQIAYRWCWAVQREMERQGGLQYSQRGGFEAPILEKMDVTHLSAAGLAEVGYGNQGAGNEGEGGGFRWGYDAFKLLARSLSPRLAEALARGIDPELLFGPELPVANRSVGHRK
jgi:neutral trehalase